MTIFIVMFKETELMEEIHILMMKKDISLKELVMIKKLKMLLFSVVLGIVFLGIIILKDFLLYL